MSVGDALGAPAEEVKKAAYVRRTSRAIPGGRPRGTPSRCSRPHPAWLQGATAAAAAAAAAPLLLPSPLQCEGLEDGRLAELRG